MGKIYLDNARNNFAIYKVSMTLMRCDTRARERTCTRVVLTAIR